MKTYLNQNTSFEENSDSNVLVLLIELRMINAFMNNNETYMDFLNADLLKRFPNMQVRAICNLPNSNFFSEKESNVVPVLNTNKSVQRKKIAFPQRDGYEFVPSENILYCNAEGAYTLVHLSGNRKFLVSKALGCIEEMLPSDIFIRIHHSTVVNVNAINNYSRTDGGYVVMSTGEKLLVSKTRKDSLLEKLGLKKD